MNKLLKLRKNKKGFTLVELLVVLVIIAILMAAIIPSMLGFIDKAKEEAIKAECRNIVLATEVVLNEQYGLGNSFADKDIAASSATAAEKGLFEQIKSMADLKNGSITALPITVDVANKTTTVGAVVYKVTSTSTTYTYQTDGSWLKG